MSNWAEITDSEREAAVRDLTRHCGDGRLTLDELEGRVEEVYAATTRDELRLALRELPRFRDEPAAPHRATPTEGHAARSIPNRRARHSPARHCGAPVVGGSAAILLTLVTVLFVTSHYVLATVLLLLWLPRAMARRTPVHA